MSTENIARFRQAASSNPELAEKIQDIRDNAGDGIAGKIAALSVEKGMPFTVEEFLAETAATPASEISEKELNNIVGGVSITGNRSSWLDVFGVPRKQSGPEPL